MIHEDIYGLNGLGHLTVAGLDAVELAGEFGTPAYILDTDKVREMCRMYREEFTGSFGPGSFPVYAGKALCYKGIYRIMAEEGMWADCVSPGELFTASSADFPMEKVFFHGNNKTDSDLEYALSLGVGHIVVDGTDELKALNSIAARKGVRPRILLRITPGIDPHTHRKIITGNVDSKFGMAVSTGQAAEFTKAALLAKNVTVDGFHCHVGSQIFEIEPFTDACRIMIGFMSDIERTTGYRASMLNLGGGFGVRYTADDPVPDYRGSIRRLAGEAKKICEENGYTMPDVFMEPGRSVVAAAGCTLYTCGTVKNVTGFRNYVSIDGGMPDNPRYALYQSRYTVVNASRAADEASFECTLGGRCCESGDLIAENIKIARPSRGDIIAVLVTGAYNYSMASNYNRIPRPPVVEISGGKASLGVRRETFEDLTRNDV